MSNAYATIHGALWCYEDGAPTIGSELEEQIGHITADWDYDPLRPTRRRGDLSTHPILIPALLAALIRDHYEDQEEDHD